MIEPTIFTNRAQKLKKMTRHFFARPRLVHKPPYLLATQQNWPQCKQTQCIAYALVYNRPELILVVL